jgi:hypothetical protein
VLIHLKPLGRVGEPIVLLDSQQFEIQRPTNPLQITRKGLDPPPPFIASSDRSMISVGLVVVGAIIIKVPLITAFALGAVPLLAVVLNSVMGVSVVNDVS